MPLSQSVQICALPGCDNPVPPRVAGARRKRNYCSNACRQKAYRNRHSSLVKRNSISVTFWEQAVDAIDHLTSTQLYTLKQRIDTKLGILKVTDALEDRSTGSQVPTRTDQVRQSPERAVLLVVRKDRGAIHLSPDHGVTLCGIYARTMLGSPYIVENACKRCLKVCNTQPKWKIWAKVFNDIINSTGNE